MKTKMMMLILLAASPALADCERAYLGGPCLVITDVPPPEPTPVTYPIIGGDFISGRRVPEPVDVDFLQREVKRLRKQVRTLKLQVKVLKRKR